LLNACNATIPCFQDSLHKLMCKSP